MELKGHKGKGTLWSVLGISASQHKHTSRAWPGNKLWVFAGGENVSKDEINTHVELSLSLSLSQKMYLFKRQSKKERQTEIFHSMFTPKMATTRQKPRAKISNWVSYLGDGIQPLRLLSTTFPGDLAGSWMWSGAARTQMPAPVWDVCIVSGNFNSLHHNASPLTVSRSTR